MNFKERVKRALRQPTRFAGGGYIRDAGGGDQIVYGSTHDQGGVDRGPDVELEGGGFGPNGEPLQGEVITNIQDVNGNMNEFYMSDQNGVADEYLTAKAENGGWLPQSAKQYFARVNEERSSQGNPSNIAAQGGYKRQYKNGGPPDPWTTAVLEGRQAGHDMATQDPWTIADLEAQKQIQQRIEQNKDIDLTGGTERDEMGVPIPSENYMKWSKATGFGGHEYKSQEHYEQGQNMKPGQMMNGYRFMGGDPMLPTSWVYIGDMGFSGEPDPQYAPKAEGGMARYFQGGYRRQYPHGGPHHMNADGTAGAAKVNTATGKPWTSTEWYAEQDRMSGTTNIESNKSRTQFNPQSAELSAIEGNKSAPGSSFNVGWLDEDGKQIETPNFDASMYGLFWQPDKKVYTDKEDNEYTTEDVEAFWQDEVNQYISDVYPDAKSAAGPKVIGGAPMFAEHIGGVATRGVKGLAAGYKWLTSGKYTTKAYQALRKSKTLNPFKGWHNMRRTTFKPYTAIKTAGKPGNFRTVSRTQMTSAVNQSAGRRTINLGKNMLLLGRKVGAYSAPWLAYQALTSEDSGASTTDVKELDFKDIGGDDEGTTQTNIYDNLRPDSSEAINTQEVTDEDIIDYSIPNQGDTVEYNNLNWIFTGTDPTNANHWTKVDE